MIDRTKAARLRQFRALRKQAGLKRLDAFAAPDLADRLAALAASSGRLALLNKEAIEQFRSTCFWNVPPDMPTLEFAELAIDRLRKHGGMAGWRLATRIIAERQRYADLVSGLDPASHRSESLAG